MLNDRRIKTSLFAIAADFFLTLFKGGLAWTTGSAALLADAYHSGTDLVVSLVLLGSLIIRFRQEKSAKTESATGARRLEAVLAIAVSLLILYVPLEILGELERRSRETLAHLWIGIAGTLATIVIVHFMARLKTHVGRETDSPALEADGYHSRIDLFSSVAVLVSLLGMMVGIYLDELAAVAIAVLIGVAGLELLFSGVRSLVRGDDLDSLSLVELITRQFGEGFTGRALAVIRRQSANIWRRGRWALLAAGLLVYGLSGVTQVDHGAVGIKQRFGDTVADALPPGLHYALPWPIERVITLPDGQVYAATVGSRLPDETGKLTRLWREIKATRVHQDNTPYLPTGDENLIDMTLTVHYRLSNPSALISWSNVHHTVTRHAEAALWQQSAAHSFNEISQYSHGSFANDVSSQLRRDLAAISIQIDLVDAQVQAVQPPALVVAVYRDRLNAAQEKIQRMTRARAQRTQDLLLASAQRLTQRADVEADARELKLRAEGEAAHFSLMAQVYEDSPAALTFHQHQQTWLQTFMNRDLIISEPAIDSLELRNWGELLGVDERL